MSNYARSIIAHESWELEVLCRYHLLDDSLHVHMSTGRAITLCCAWFTCMTFCIMMLQSPTHKLLNALQQTSQSLTSHEAGPAHSAKSGSGGTTSPLGETPVVSASSKQHALSQWRWALLQLCLNIVDISSVAVTGRKRTLFYLNWCRDFY